MGISTYYYTLYGFKMDDYPDDFSEAYDHAYENLDGIDVVADDMGGDYIYFGHVFFKSGDYRWNEVDGIEAVIEPDTLPALKESISAAFLKQFPSLAHYLDDAKWGIYTFLHFT